MGKSWWHPQVHSEGQSSASWGAKGIWVTVRWTRAALWDTHVAEMGRKCTLATHGECQWGGIFKDGGSWGK